MRLGRIKLDSTGAPDNLIAQSVVLIPCEKLKVTGQDGGGLSDLSAAVTFRDEF